MTSILFANKRSSIKFFDINYKYIILTDLIKIEYFLFQCYKKKNYHTLKLKLSIFVILLQDTSSIFKLENLMQNNLNILIMKYI